MSNSETAVLIDELLSVCISVCRKISKCEAADRKKKRRHSKAKFTSDRTSQFVQVFMV